MAFEKEKKVFKKLMTALDFELVKTTKYSELWKHFAKSISFQLSGSPNSHNWLHDAKRQFQKLISSNFDKVHSGLTYGNGKYDYILRF